MNTTQLRATTSVHRTPYGAAREMLLAQKNELWRQLQASSGTLAELEKCAEDDQARLLHDQFVSLRVGHLTSRRLRQIDAALARLADGSYGICCDCGGSISPKRLAAIPSAERCIACQEQAAGDHGPAPAMRKAA